MRILILNWRDTSHPKSGGAEAVTLRHAQGWVNAGHTVTWLTSRYDKVPGTETIGGIRFIRKAGSLRIYFYAPWYLLFHGKQYDVIVDEIHGIPFFAPLFTRTPVVVFIHEIAGEIWDFMFPFPVNTIGKMLEHWYFRLYRRCLFWTDAPSMIDELVSHGIPRKQCVSIPCPITDDVEAMVVRKFPKEKNPTYIFVSRVVKMKGIEEVIKAFSFIVREQPDAKLWIVGGGDARYVEALRQMLMEYGVAGQTTFWGKVTTEKKYELLSRAHLLLHASVKEGWGLVVLEAAAVGTPSVVYDVPGLRDVVKNGRTGIVLPDFSPRTMAREAVRAFNDHKQYRTFQDNGKKWVRSLRWEDVIRSSLAVLYNASGTTTTR